MNRVTISLFATLLFAFVLVFLGRSKEETRPPTVSRDETTIPNVAAPEPPTVKSEKSEIAIQQPQLVSTPPPSEEPEKKEKRLTLPYEMSDGVAVVMGDVAIGKPTEPNAPDTGIAIVPPVRPWSTRVIPYHIQPDVVNPDRIQQALALFDRTVLRFVQHTNEQDALVFENAEGVCKSYVGRIGGFQPIWIPPGCGPSEIAHEILHALGFIHEQNRFDRDEFINVLFNNIEEKYRFNFEKLPPEYMLVSGLAPFDFNSLMMYPVWMFVSGGQATMESKIRDRQIQPSPGLSDADVARVNAAFGK